MSNLKTNATKRLQLKKTLELADYVKMLAKKDKFVLIYPSGGGFKYVVFWTPRKGGKHELVAASPKIYRTKAQCISTLKKVYDFFSSTFSFAKYAPVYDQHGTQISMEIKYTIKYQYD